MSSRSSLVLSAYGDNKWKNHKKKVSETNLRKYTQAHTDYIRLLSYGVAQIYGLGAYL